MGHPSYTRRTYAQVLATAGRSPPSLAGSSPRLSPCGGGSPRRTAFTTTGNTAAKDTAGAGDASGEAVGGGNGGAAASGVTRGTPDKGKRPMQEPGPSTATP